MHSSSNASSMKSFFLKKGLIKVVFFQSLSTTLIMFLIGNALKGGGDTGSIATLGVCQHHVHLWRKDECLGLRLGCLC